MFPLLLSCYYLLCICRFLFRIPPKMVIYFRGHLVKAQKKKVRGLYKPAFKPVGQGTEVEPFYITL